MSSFLKNVECRPIVKLFTQKGLHATGISKALYSIYKDDAPSYRTVTKWVTEFKDSERGFEDPLRMGRPSTITTDENIEAIERRDRQISTHRPAYELTILTTTVYEITSNHVSMKKVSTRWGPKLLTSIQHSQIVVKSFCKRAK